MSRSAVVQMKELPEGDATYELRWLGALQLADSRQRPLEIHALLAAESGQRVRLWLPLDRMPLLMLGSRWHRKAAVAAADTPRDIEPLLSMGATWVCPDSAGDVVPEDWLGGRFPHPSGGWQFWAADGAQYVLPVSELIRTHYVFDPRLLPSILGGVSESMALTGRSRQAWHPDQCRWMDGPGGTAQFRISRFMSNEGAFRLARLWFSEPGRRGLSLLFHAFRRLRVTGSSPAPGSQRTGLPRVEIPYAGTAKWKVITRELPGAPGGPRRYLIVALTQHSAQPPWRELVIDDGIVRRKPAGTEDPGAAVSPPSSGVPFRLEPIPKPNVTVATSATDGRYNPLRARDVQTLDLEADAFRSTRKTASEVGPGAADPRRPGFRPVDSGGTDVPGSHAANIPVVLPGNQMSPIPGDYAVPFGRDLRPVFEKVLTRLQDTVDPSCVGRFLPSREKAHRFELKATTAKTPVRPATTPDRRIKPRQLLIFELRCRDKWLYLIEPTRRSRSERFPIGIVYRSDWAGFLTGDIVEVASAFEFATRTRRGWINHLSEFYAVLRAIGVDHPPTDLGWDAREPGLVDRLAGAIAGVILEDG